MSAKSLLSALLLLVALPLSAQQYEVTHFDSRINTKGSETGAVVIDDTTLLYSSHYDANAPVMRLYSATWHGAESVTQGEVWQLNDRHCHTGNAAYDSRADRLYFTHCTEDEQGTIRCEIFYSDRSNGKWQRPHRLAGDVNLADYTSTQPAVGYLDEGHTILYFSSDRPGGMGGLDIWYTVIRNGKSTLCANLGAPVNGPADEITPFYDTLSHRLFFSSNRVDGYGGYDVYVAYGQRDAWQAPSNLGYSLNSGYNDIYFSLLDTASGFFASNREDSFFATESSCCNDVYFWKLRPESKPVRYAEQLKAPVVADDSPELPPSGTARRQDAVRAMFPLSLYFHNDEPDPRSKVATTDKTYFQTYNSYMFLRPDYKRAWNIVTDSLQRDSVCRALDHFFEVDVHGGCVQFEAFIEELAQDLCAGRRVRLVMRGYASPWHTADYNDLLSKRRIATMVNQIRQWKGGRLCRYIDAGNLDILQEPYGSSRAMTDKKVSLSQLYPQQFSVYSVEAASERRIDIVDYEFF